MLDQIDLEEDFASQGSTVLEQLTHWSLTRADDICLYYGEEGAAYSFSDFNKLTNCVANGLRALGVTKGDRVSVLSRNAFVTVVAMFASWKLGALYCPVNNNYRGSLLAYILRDTGPKVLIADQSYVDSLNTLIDDIVEWPQVVVYQPPIDAHDYDEKAVAGLDDSFSSVLFTSLLSANEADPGIRLADSDLASIIYTSGTTGQPKGVVQNHRWIHAYNYYGLKSAHRDNVFYSDLPLYHVGGAMLSVCGAVWAGCQVALWDRFSPENYWRRIRECGATHALLVDTMIDWLMEASASDDDRQHCLKVVNMMPLPANHNAVARRFGIAFVQCGYGSTELGVGFTGLIDELGASLPKPAKFEKGYSRDAIRELHGTVAPDCSLLDGTRPISKGFMGTVATLVEARVVDAAGRPVAADVPGQVAFRHKLPDVIFREYLNKPEATTCAVRDGWYYPSDIVRYDERGIFYFEDRQQGFIRVRGENLSASTVEQQLNDHPEVNRCAVVGIPALQGNEEDVAAFVVVREGSQVTPDQLQSWARENLAKFMWPKYISIVSTLPVTPTFKVEKFKLKEKLMSELSATTV